MKDDFTDMMQATDKKVRGTCRLSEVRHPINKAYGTHEEGLGWNPQGLFCGECGSLTCQGCPSEYKQCGNCGTCTQTEKCDGKPDGEFCEYYMDKKITLNDLFADFDEFTRLHLKWYQRLYLWILSHLPDRVVEWIYYWEFHKR